VQPELWLQRDESSEGSGLGGRLWKVMGSGCGTDLVIRGRHQSLHFPGSLLQHIQGWLPAAMELGHIEGHLQLPRPLRAEVGGPGGQSCPSPEMPSSPPPWSTSCSPHPVPGPRPGLPQRLPQQHLFGYQVATQEAHSISGEQGAGDGTCDVWASTGVDDLGHSMG
jgi:hypothetical protein